MAKQEKSSSFGPIAAIVGSGFLPIVIAIILFFAFQGQANGASGDQVINPAPGSQQSDALADLGCDANPTSCITKNSSQLTDIQNQLQTLLTAVNNGSTPYGALTNKSQVTSEIQTGITDVKTLEQNVADPTKFQSQASTLGTELAKIDQLTTNGIDGNTSAAIVQWAKQTVDYNDDGTGAIKYQQLASYPIVNGYPQEVDCSGFVGWVLYKAGVLKTFAPRPPNTSGFISYAQNSSLGFSFVQGFSFNDSADYDTQVVAAVGSGLIKPGDLFFSGDPGTDSAHIVMYIGGDPSQDIAESTTVGDKNGPQYASLAERTSDNHIIRAVIQPPGV